MTAQTDIDIAQFFAEFERASADEAWSRYGAMFLPTFLNLDPNNATVVARDDLIAFLPQRKALFDRAGATGTTLTDLDVETLDDRHVLARTTWAVQFNHEHQPVELRTTFTLRHEDRWRIAVYLNHRDLLDALGQR